MDLVRYCARGIATKNNRIGLVTDRPMEVLEALQPSVNHVETSRVTAEYCLPVPLPIE